MFASKWQIGITYQLSCIIIDYCYFIATDLILRNYVLIRVIRGPVDDAVVKMVDVVRNRTFP